MIYRTQLIQIKLTELEKKKLQEQAQKEQKSVSEYIRKKCNL